MCGLNELRCRQERTPSQRRPPNKKKIPSSLRGCNRRPGPRAGCLGRTLPKGGRWITWMDWVLAAAGLALCGNNLRAQFDPVSVALFVRQTFVVSQDTLHQKACRLVHVDVVLWEGYRTAHVRGVLCITEYNQHLCYNINRFRFS